MLPGAADSDCVATRSRAGTRCSAALTVVSTTPTAARGLSGGRAATAWSCAAPRRRHAATPGRRAGSPRPETRAPRSPARRTRARAPAAPCAARRGRPRAGWSPARSAAPRRRARDRRRSGPRRRPRRRPASARGRARAIRRGFGDVFAITRPRRSGMRACGGTAPCRDPAAFRRAPITQASSSGSGTSISRSNSSSSASLSVADMRVGKAPGDQIDLAHAAMPGAEQQAPPPLVQAFARSGAAGHVCSNTKSPDGPGEADIATESANVSASAQRLMRYCRASPGITPCSEPNPPPGFEPLFRTSPFLDTVGPLFYRRDPERGLVIGLRIAEKHANARGIAHGGLLLTLADIALGYQHGVWPGPAHRHDHGEPECGLRRRRQDRRLGRGACGHPEDRWPPHLRQRIPAWSTASASCGRARCSPAPRRWPIPS